MRGANGRPAPVGAPEGSSGTAMFVLVCLCLQASMLGRVGSI